ncbi:hypothetical protein CC78DRAFT_581025 [Lojkania enalia]|uniref:TM7S3/TM198-like domain-containing protein n=1 Tax=Lojkania enalia TaxID=147567 RepID=A0A9P4KCE3_9PLEO|nr:hypothetical protein CC78DRAFT_581025 [Didymosphaeria enalia]
MRSERYLLIAVALLVCLDLAVALRHPLYARQDDSPSSRISQAPSSARSEPSQAPSSTPVDKDESSSARGPAQTSRAGDAPSTPPVKPASSAVLHASVTAASNEPLPSSTAAATPNPLPIKPKITPAMGISGVILLISGIVYTVIGIKNKWLYVFFSAAYLASLSVSVLIVYLMSPPVSDAVQGAFFVAAFVTGLIFGGLALVFPDITDGLGCLLGGFCLSMWFLTLKEGGLITSTTGRAIFIGVMSFAGFSLSFSHYTRNYGLIVSISFAGATVTVLGIDCLSRAGWKEFWLYLWDLNSSTFPLNTNTYPITKGIRVEVACVIIICVGGLVSQMKLWKLVKERREKNASQRLEREENIQREEEELGRRIEDNFSRERAQWEATYGDKSLAHDSAFDSSNNSVQKSSFSLKEKGLSESVEMVDITPQQPTSVGRASSKASGKRAMTGPKVTVTVLQEDDIQEIDHEGNPVPPKKSVSTRLSNTIENIDNSARNSVEQVSVEPSGASRSVSARSSLRASVPPPPAVVPLPFTIPKEEDTQSQEDDNASVSAVPESVHTTLSNRRSLVKRLSGGSALKRFSRASVDDSDMEEALIVPHIEDDRASSVAATLDDDLSLPDVSPPHTPLALDDSERSAPNDIVDASKAPKEAITKDVEVERGDFGEAFRIPSSSVALSESNPTTSKSADDKLNEGDTGKANKVMTFAVSVNREPQNPTTARAITRQSLTISTDPKADPRRSKRTSSSSFRQPSSIVGSITHDNGPRSPHSPSTKSGDASRSSRIESHNGGLSGALPEKMSKVAKSYRTNEWAKHLESAEKPEVDDIPEPESPGVRLEGKVEEVANSITISTTKARRESTSSNVHRNSNLARSSSDLTKYAHAGSLQALSRPPSAVALSSQPVPPSAFPASGISRAGSKMQNRGFRSSSTPYLTPAALESPAEELAPTKISPIPSTIPDNTLMSQREALVRNKVTSHSFAPQASTPNLVAGSDTENITLAQRKQQIQNQSAPLMSQQWRQSSWANGSQMQIYDSHQPKRTPTGSDQERREVMLANWRESIRQNVAPAQVAVVDEQTRRAAMINDRRQKEAIKQQQDMAAQYRDSMMGSMMRSNEMLDAHREAMRRMQAKANKKA